MSTALGLLAAVLACLGYGAASVLQAVGARRAAGTTSTTGTATTGGGAAGLARQPLYLGGLALDALAWLVSLAALRVLPLFAVQALLAGSLAVTAVLGARVLGLPLGRTGRGGVLAVVVALAVLAAGAQPGRPAPPPGAVGVALLLAAVALLALAAAPARLVARALPGPRVASAVLAAAGGLGYTTTALAARLLPTSPVPALLAEPALWALLVGGAAGTVLYGRSLAGDGVVVATALLWVVEVVAGGAAGLALGDGVRPGWAVPVAVAAVVALGACALLARPAAAAAAEAAGTQAAATGAA